MNAEQPAPSAFKTASKDTSELAFVKLVAAAIKMLREKTKGANVEALLQVAIEDGSAGQWALAQPIVIEGKETA